MNHHDSPQRLSFACGALLLVACGARIDNSNAALVIAQDAATDAPGDDALSCPIMQASTADLTLDSPSFASMCGPGDTVTEYSCSGVTIVIHGKFVDCETTWIFDPGSKQLLATLSGCNTSQVCEGAVQGFVFPNDCYSGSAPWTDQHVLCDGFGTSDSGTAPSASDAR
ncbi:MAG: hypothetical protein ACHREM_26820 [Polyangiales bacterium]